MHKALETPVAAFKIKVDLDQFVDAYAENMMIKFIGTFDAAGDMFMFHVEPSQLAADIMGAH